MSLPRLRHLCLLAVLTVLSSGYAWGDQSVARQWNEALLNAIRIDLPNPPGHARNLHHTAIAMYDAWAAYDSTAVGYVVNEKVSPLPGDIAAARNEAISYAAYKIISTRFASSVGSGTTLPALDALLTNLGYSTTTAQSAVTNGTAPAEVGKRIAQMVLNYGAQDGFSQTTYPQPYTSSVNPNMSVPMTVLGLNDLDEASMQLGRGIPAGTDPNLWQPLTFESVFYAQNNIIITPGTQTFVGVQSLATQPFSLTRTDATKPWLDPYGGPSKLGTASDAAYKANFFDTLKKVSQLNDTTLIDISPGATGNNPLPANPSPTDPNAGDIGTGYTSNPVIGGTYAPNMVERGNFARVLAEFWADGPNSETPPGHWHVLANEVADMAALQKRIGGTGPTVDSLQWDVKTYLALSGAVHNAACAAWSLKRYYSGTRPITAIRYMSSKGQSTYPPGSVGISTEITNVYHVEGIPLETNVVEVITAATAASGGKHETIWDVATNTTTSGAAHIGEIAVRGWPGEDPGNPGPPSAATIDSPIRWMLGKDWLPFQRKTFNTPAFPGYVSGHSTFSRAAAEVLTLITGSPYFPGGFHHHTVNANTLTIDLGPSSAVDLQWASYYDAADQAGISRRYGGIHPYEDDFQGRYIGAQAGISAYSKAASYWNGTIQSTEVVPTVVMKANGSAKITWNAVLRKINKLQKSTNFSTWTDVGQLYPNDTTESLIDRSPAVGTVYRIITVDPSPARAWNEELLAAIRRDVPNPPGHARNLHHTAVAMYDAWAAYSTTALGYLYNEKVSPLPVDIETARREAISYAAYRVLRSRFAFSISASTSLASFDAQLTTMGYSPSIGQSAITNGTTPAEVGKRIGQMILNWGAQDGFSQTTYPQAYTSAINSNLSYPMPVLGTIIDKDGIYRSDRPLGFGIDTTHVNPNLWQPLSLSNSVTQNGFPIVLNDNTQTFAGVQSLATLPFSLSRTDNTQPWYDPFGGPSLLGTASDAAYKANFMDTLRKVAALNSTTTVNISPGAFGNNPLPSNPSPTDPNAGDTGTGYATNPVTGGSYAANDVQLGDFARVLAEFWADGPHSETPPGHWHVLANEVADDPSFVKRLRGTGSVVNDLEWDVKTYFSLSGGVHNAACAAWSLKRYYSGTRPITAIRYMASLGQSSNPAGPSYHPQGIPLETDLVEVITDTTAAPGGKHEDIWDVNSGRMVKAAGFLDYLGQSHNFIGQIAVKGWPGEDPDNLPAPSIATHQTTVKWMLGKDWLPFQRKTFNTPAFPGYISGHSTFSRSAAEVLTLITGSQYFPGGFHHHTVEANTMQIDLGPSTDIDLQWASYYDAADQAGISRRYGGIHPYEDDFHGRYIGAQVGISAFTKAEQYWNAAVPTSTEIVATVTYNSDGTATISWPAVLGKMNKVQRSTSYSTWTDVHNSYPRASTWSFVDLAPVVGATYRIVTSDPTPARVWNEQLLAAIRIDKPNPPAHARNLFHVATAMYDAWAAYDTTSIGYIHHERQTAGNVAAARKEAMSYAAYRMMRNRFAASINVSAIFANIDAQMAALGYPTTTTTTVGNTPAALGNRIAADIIAWGNADGSNQAGGYGDPSYTNPQPALIVLKDGLPRGYGIPYGTNPNLWQPLAFDAAQTQNNLQADLIQKYVGVTWLQTLPFAHERSNSALPWIDPGPPSMLYTAGGTPTLAEAASDLEYKQGCLYVLEASARLNDPTLINMSPKARGNNPLGTDDGTGYAINPYTNQPYADNYVKFGDYARVMAEFWADGPNSETPPGHWHVLFNEVADDPRTVKQIGGTGPVVDDLEWDAKGYFALAASTHDAACAVWSVKRAYQGVRPITAIRYMASKGQSSIPGLPNYNQQGLLLEDGVCEQVTATSKLGRHSLIFDMSIGTTRPGLEGEIVVYSWPGEPNNRATETSSVRWMRAIDWVPYQREDFNTPAFPGYISGHSGFSRAAAEVMTAITNNTFFPGGLGVFTANANAYLVFEMGPTQTMQLQWATYYDAADLAGNSRRWGGIHVREDDFKSRIIGATSGKNAWALAKKYFDGEVLTESVAPTQSVQANGNVVLTSHTRRGLYYQWEYSTDLQNWIPLTTSTRATDSSITYTDTPPPGVTRFYRARWVAQ